MNILIAGDFFISDNFHGKNLIDNSVQDLFEKADYRILNHEAPITNDNSKNKILKTGPHLQTSATTTIPILRQLKIDMVTLANNHILDFGDKGIHDTFNILNSENISFVGAGNNLKEASIPFTFEKEGLKICILNFAENEWSIAEKNKPGANPLDVVDNIIQIKAAKKNHDKVICIIHGGHEYYNYPSPQMVKQYQFYADNGADAILCHHSHCIGGYEILNNVPIVYGLGNFLFTLPSKREEWYIGYLVQLSITKGKPIIFEIFPTFQEKNTFITKLFQNERKESVFQKVEEFKNIIADKEKLQETWDDFILKREDEYLKNLSPVNSINNRYIRAGLHRMGISKIFMNNNYLKLILNLIRCEAHYNVTKEIIKKKLERN